MIIAGITDIHGATQDLKEFATQVLDIDVLLIAGDLTMFGSHNDAEAILAPLRGCAPSLLAVSGNCDRSDIERYLIEDGCGIHGTHHMVNGVAFAGLGGALEGTGCTPNEHSDEDLASALENAFAAIPEGSPVVLVSHQPPHGTQVDMTHRGQHVGSMAVRACIENQQPLLCLSGHIHESRGLDALGKTQLVNPGPLRERHYMRAELTPDGVTVKIPSF
jgi:Icc-related predicted phosphoesterase